MTMTRDEGASDGAVESSEAHGNQRDFSRVINHTLVPFPGTYHIDPVHTFVGFRAQHLIVGRVRGRFESVAGVAAIGDDPLESTLEVSVEAASIHTLMPVRDEDLRSGRYLDVEHHPQMTYRSSQITERPSGNWVVTGDLTIRGVTKTVELVVRFGGATADPFGNQRLAFRASGSISRKDFGLTYELEKESGALTIAADVDLDIDAELIRPL